MAGMKAGDKRRLSILKDLQENECCTYEYIMNTYQISERSMQADIKALCKQGYLIKGVKAKQGYILKDAPGKKNQGYYETTDAQKIRKLFIMLILQNSNGYTIERILHELQKYNLDSITADIKTVRAALEELIEERMLVCNNDVYIVSTMAPIQLALNTSEALEVLNLLEACSKGHHYQSTLNDIRRKFTIALFNEPEEEYTSSAYVVYNKKYEEAEKLDNILAELNRYPFEKKQLEITFVNQKGLEITGVFSIGNIVYSVEKDRVYLIVEREETPYIIYYGSVKEIKPTEVENTVFQNDFYRKITDSMFSISIDPPVHVKVEFDNRFQIKDKLSKLLANRTNASIEVNGDCLIYEDEISGLNDFARYLRRYGYSCRVIEPEILKDKLLESAERILEAYARLEERNE